MIETSYETQVSHILSSCSKILYEDNPNRVGWVSHKNNYTDKPLREDSTKNDMYYLYFSYMNNHSVLLDEIINIDATFYNFVETFKSGTTSIHNMINYYTVEGLEERINRYTKIVDEALNIRKCFIVKNSI